MASQTANGSGGSVHITLSVCHSKFHSMNVTVISCFTLSGLGFCRLLYDELLWQLFKTVSAVWIVVIMLLIFFTLHMN